MIGRRVVVVGATGNVGSATVRALASEDAVSSVIGVARRPPVEHSSWSPKVSWVSADISTDQLDVVRGADAVVNLAWRLQPSRDEQLIHATNVRGTHRLVRSAIAHGVPAFVQASSVGTYAPGPKRPPVDESWPATGVPTSTYSRHKAEVEALLDDVEAAYPQLRIVRMRTSLVFQESAASEIHRIFLGRLAPWHLPRPLRLVPDLPELAFQATHADDIARAYVAATLRDVRGAFNVGAEPVLTSALMASLVDGRAVAVTSRVLRAAVKATFALRLQPTEPGWLDLALQTPLMDTTRARTELGWSETTSASDALRGLLAAMGAGDGDATLPLHPRRRRGRLRA